MRPDITRPDNVKVFQKVQQLAPQFAPTCAMVDFEEASVAGFQHVYHNATATHIVAYSFCVRSDILSALIRRTYSRVARTATARTRTRPARPSSDDFSVFGISNGGSWINL